MGIKKIYLLERQSDRGTDFILSNDFIGQVWARPKPGAWSFIQVSHVGVKGLSPQAAFSCFPRPASRESEQLDSMSHSDKGWQLNRQQLNLLRHSVSQTPGSTLGFR